MYESWFALRCVKPLDIISCFVWSGYRLLLEPQLSCLAKDRNLVGAYWMVALSGQWTGFILKVVYCLVGN